MKRFTLEAITHRGANKLREAGNPSVWTLVKEIENLFNQRGAWLLLEPDTAPAKSRWVHEENDDDFIVREIT
jgi:hypothetical protein